MADTVDVDAYFQRIGYNGNRQPTLAVLRDVNLRHTLTIPFENLDSLLRRPVNLDLQSLQEKMVRGGRGGYCFEQNLLLGSVLRALGYHVTDLAARVVWNGAAGAVRPRTHMLMQIDLKEDGSTVPYIVDVGFGGMVLTGPVRLAPDIEQPTPHEPFRLTKHEDSFMLQALIREKWSSLYQFDLQPQSLADYEMANWYVSNHPQSPFVTSLMAARLTVDRRYALFNNQLSIHHLRGESEQRTIVSAAELRTLLETTFGLSLPDTPDPATALERIVSGSGT